jgi:hypothetical protein
VGCLFILKKNIYVYFLTKFQRSSKLNLIDYLNLVSYDYIENGNEYNDKKFKKKKADCM